MNLCNCMQVLNGVERDIITTTTTGPEGIPVMAGESTGGGLGTQFPLSILNEPSYWIIWKWVKGVHR